MIKGKAKAEFGTGDVRMTSLLHEGTIGVLCFETQEPHAIGEIIPVTDDFDVTNVDIMLTFTKTESIDVLIEELEDVKRMMNGYLSPDKVQKHNEPFDLETFLTK